MFERIRPVSRETGRNETAQESCSRAKKPISAAVVLPIRHCSSEAGMAERSYPSGIRPPMISAYRCGSSGGTGARHAAVGSRSRRAPNRPAGAARAGARAFGEDADVQPASERPCLDDSPVPRFDLFELL